MTDIERLARREAEYHADMIASKVFERFGCSIGLSGTNQIAATIYAEMRNALSAAGSTTSGEKK